MVYKDALLASKDAANRRIHAFCARVVVTEHEGFWSNDTTNPACAFGSSAGSAAAELVNTFSTKKASMGDRSIVPPSGGIIPRKMLRYGSQIVLQDLKKTT